MRTLITLLFTVISASAQVVPFIQGGISGARNMSYDKPNPFVEPGIEYD